MAVEGKSGSSMILLVRALMVTAALLCAGIGGAYAKDKLTFAYSNDPTHDVLFEAIRTGLVKSDLVDIELDPVSIPATGQALLGRQFDVIEVAAFLLPPAVSQGLSVSIVQSSIGRSADDVDALSIWVRDKSPIKDVSELKGKRIATFSLGSTGTALTRYALHAATGMDISLRGGDLQFIELPLPTIPAAIETGTVDAGMLIYLQTDDARRTGLERPVFVGQEDLIKEWKASLVFQVAVAFPDRIAADPQKYVEFNRLFRASLKYALDHPEMMQQVLDRVRA